MRMFKLVVDEHLELVQSYLLQLQVHSLIVVVVVGHCLVPAVSESLRLADLELIHLVLHIFGLQVLLDGWSIMKGVVAFHYMSLEIRRTIKFKLVICRLHMKTLSEVVTIEVILSGT
jgi:hypothetical protein